jgi:hypothetical protein
MRPGPPVAEHAPTIGPAHEQLRAFEGQWRVQGEYLSGAPRGAGESVVGDETFEWMTGGYFLLNLWSRHSVSTDHEGLAFVGYDADADRYEWRAFDNLGFSRHYDVDIGEGVMLLSGQRERGQIAVDGDHMTIAWECSSDGEHWEPLCALSATRVT